MVEQTAVADMERLVRSELGCACPDRVFGRIDIAEAPPQFAGLSGDYLIAVGMR
jgi:hypothetical protein